MLSVCMCLCLRIPPYTFLNAWSNLYEFDMYVMAFKPVSTVYFINPCPQSVFLYVYFPLVARQRLSKKVTAETNTQATTEELMDASLSIFSLSYERKLCY
jgi:hypothetical protein